ncbi:oxidoreductase [Rhodohalobacter sp. SW132]|nr:oxidoreductase [Rhodohalobacter sp. SW132]
MAYHADGPGGSAIAAGLWRSDSWNYSPQELLNWIESALEIGITTFDHADIYGLYTNEARFGEALKINPSLREKMEIVTKCDICLVCDQKPEYRINHYNTTPEHIRQSVENSLRNLQTDYIDLLLLHRPDPLMDADSTAGTLDELIKSGKVRHAGVSNFSPSQFDLLQSRLDAPLVTNQVECSLHHLEPIFDGTFDHAQMNRITPMIWSPFAGGALFWGDDERAQRVRHTIGQLTEKYSASAAQIVIAWLLALPCNPQPVLGTGKAERLQEAAAALEIKLDRQDWFELLVASQGHPVP